MPISVNTKIQDPGVGAVDQAALGSLTSVHLVPAYLSEQGSKQRILFHRT